MWLRAPWKKNNYATTRNQSSQVVNHSTQHYFFIYLINQLKTTASNYLIYAFLYDPRSIISSINKISRCNYGILFSSRAKRSENDPFFNHFNQILEVNAFRHHQYTLCHALFFYGRAIICETFCMLQYLSIPGALCFVHPVVIIIRRGLQLSPVISYPCPYLRWSPRPRSIKNQVNHNYLNFCQQQQLLSS